MQLESMDEQLRNGLWSVFYDMLVEPGKQSGYNLIKRSSEYELLLGKLWRQFYKWPADTMPVKGWSRSVDVLRQSFYSFKWNEVYDFIEFIAQNVSPLHKTHFVKMTDLIFRREMAGYRFINDEITRITADEEIAEIEQAINEANANPVSSHLKRALELLSDKTEPDYGNSIKESISAVEALCANLTGATTLGQALTKLDKDSTIKTHPALNEAFKKLYGYTSNAGGIRHALLEEDSLEFEDAKFMLVSCSAFVNYLQAKAAKKP